LMQLFYQSGNDPHESPAGFSSAISAEFQNNSSIHQGVGHVVCLLRGSLMKIKTKSGLLSSIDLI